MSPLRLSAAVSIDVVLLTIRHGQLSVLLVERGSEPFKGSWALPGGFVEDDEDLLDAAGRELCEETSVASFSGHLEQLRTYGAPGRDPRGRVVSVAHLALVPDVGVVRGGDDAAAARFWPVGDVGTADGPSLVFDHAGILADGVERARAKLEYTPLATAFAEEPFSLAELRRVYEAVWGTELHRANFRRRVLSAQGFVEPVGGELYRRGSATLLHPAILRPAGDAGARADEWEEGGL
jgi:8-oxo-dGTP diphosphatase